MLFLPFNIIIHNIKSISLHCSIHFAIGIIPSNIMALPLQHSFSCIVAGPSKAGKSVWVSRLLNFRNDMITPKPTKIIWCYSEYQPLYDTLKDVELHQGMINIDDLDKTEPKLLICDDMMSECDQNMCDIFTKHGHHRNLSIIYITQNLFEKGKYSRTMSLNANYLVLFKNPRDIHQIDYLARQMYPKGSTNFLSESFRNATSVNHGYLFIDLTQNCEELLRIRTGVLPDEKTYIYMPRCSSSSLERYNLSKTDHEQKVEETR